jgi:hypothetical protein
VPSTDSQLAISLNAQISSLRTGVRFHHRSKTWVLWYSAVFERVYDKVRWADAVLRVAIRVNLGSGTNLHRAWCIQHRVRVIIKWGQQSSLRYHQDSTFDLKQMDDWYVLSCLVILFALFPNRYTQHPRLYIRALYSSVHTVIGYITHVPTSCTCISEYSFVERGKLGHDCVTYRSTPRISLQLVRPP